MWALEWLIMRSAPELFHFDSFILPTEFHLELPVDKPRCEHVHQFFTVQSCYWPSYLQSRFILVLHPSDNLGCRARQTDHGPPLPRTATRHWSVWRTPFGPVGTRPSALLRSLDTQITVSPAVARLASNRVPAGCILNYHLDGVLIVCL